jgi:hypothetical protein
MTTTITQNQPVGYKYNQWFTRQIVSGLGMQVSFHAIKIIQSDIAKPLQYIELQPIQRLYLTKQGYAIYLTDTGSMSIFRFKRYNTSKPVMCQTGDRPYPELTHQKRGLQSIHSLFHFCTKWLIFRGIRVSARLLIVDLGGFWKASI